MSETTLWVQVGELSDAFKPEAYTLPPSNDLIGTTQLLYAESGDCLELTFADAERLTCKVIRGADAGRSDIESYRATSIRPGFYLVDFIWHRPRLSSVSVVLDMETACFTALFGYLPDAVEGRRDLYGRVLAGEELTAVEVDILHGTLDEPPRPGQILHGITDELVGLRNRYTYSANERYEHVYTNAGFYSWQCLKGVEKGLADTDRCHYYRIANQLYFFVWREKIIPTLGVLMIDLKAMRTDGKILGYVDSSFTQLSNFAVGAYAEIMNFTPNEN